MAFVTRATPLPKRSAGHGVLRTMCCARVTRPASHPRLVVKSVQTPVSTGQIYQGYINLVEPERQKFMERRAVREVLSAGDNKPLTLGFVLYMSARGVRITEPVEGWLIKAGERCKKLGMSEIGDALVAHAKEEANHDKMYESDAKRMARLWNGLFPSVHVNGDSLLKQTYLNPGENAYYEAHKDAISSPAPYRVLAIANEIERLSGAFGIPLLNQVEKCLGKPVREELSFLHHHCDIDIKHCEDNEKQMRYILQEYPHDVQELARVGCNALRGFGDYLDDCLVLTNALVARVVMKNNIIS